MNYSGTGSAKKNVILDTNVIYSGLHKSEGVCGKVILRGTGSLVSLYSIDFAGEELRINLQRKMALSKQEVDLILSALPIEWLPREVYSDYLDRAIDSVRNLQDSPFVAASMATGFPLVTGDKHLQTPRVRQVIKVYTPREFAVVVIS